MTPFDKLLAAAAKLVQLADGSRDTGTKIAMKEIASSIRGATATIRNALEAEKPNRPAKFALFQGDESPMPGAEKPKTRRAGA
jgi:hypothetical protein